jgi:hypothetical protein
VEFALFHLLGPAHGKDPEGRIVHMVCRVPVSD